MERYNFKEIDSKWQKVWNEKKIYNSKINTSKKKPSYEEWNGIKRRHNKLKTKKNR